MANLNNPILVPWDFSPKSDKALLHAIKFAKTLEKSILLLHIAKRESEIEEKTQLLKKRAAECLNEFDIQPIVMVKVGSIFTTITETISSVEASLAIMGTHGLKGMQKLTGSWALKVILGSESPFVVVQAMPSRELNNIVFPLDFKMEKKEMLIWVNYLSKFYKSKIHLCYQEPSDGNFKKKTHSNILSSRNYLAGKGIDYEIVKLPNKGKMTDETVTYASEQKAGLILIVTSRGLQSSDFIISAEEEKLIANKEEIPVMVINPRSDLRRFSGFGL